MLSLDSATMAPQQLDLGDKKNLEFVSLVHDTWSLTKAHDFIAEFVAGRLTAAGLNLEDLRERVHQLPLNKHTRPELWAKIRNTPLQVTDEELKTAIHLEESAEDLKPGSSRDRQPSEKDRVHRLRLETD